MGAIPGTGYLIPADVYVPKLRSDSARPLCSVKTYHCQAQRIEKCTPYGAGVHLQFSQISIIAHSTRLNWS
jgi:hypothetical protein